MILIQFLPKPVQVILYSLIGFFVIVLAWLTGSSGYWPAGAVVLLASTIFFFKAFLVFREMRKGVK